ncbi:helix-turn-helix domain-containing protein [Lentibacter sp. XHP0401]|jgi:transcriptional regulator with XRE-family HTH domain|uniref:helix-turn-helix domain-containing protein n=1 Tax=Lentibacter sp. XHP0401 TaxID=2984334 RepID=UPI0021E73B77|nr:helix-turn-helix transcriptional regulator [Lentibacter sp. XHP0401]MCV2893289.1 helix-turn-helix domain-containing protein [Lentibacter sp. XHP0401]
MSEEQSKDWFDPETSTFGDRVAGAREAAGMDQKQLSKRLGVKLVTLQNWENDMAEPRANKLSMLAGMLNVSMMWLLEGTGEGVDPEQVISREEKDMNEILAEIVDLKARSLRTANRLGALEKKLRTWVD